MNFSLSRYDTIIRQYYAKRISLNKLFQRLSEFDDINFVSFDLNILRHRGFACQCCGHDKTEYLYREAAKIDAITPSKSEAMNRYPDSTETWGSTYLHRYDGIIAGTTPIDFHNGKMKGPWRKEQSGHLFFYSFYTRKSNAFLEGAENEQDIA